MSAPAFQLTIPDPYEVNPGYPHSHAWLRMMLRWMCGTHSKRLIRTADIEGIEITAWDLLGILQAAADVADPDTGIIYGDARLIERALIGQQIPDRVMEATLVWLCASGYMAELAKVPAVVPGPAAPREQFRDLFQGAVDTVLERFGGLNVGPGRVERADQVNPDTGRCDNPDCGCNLAAADQVPEQDQAAAPDQDQAGTVG